MAASKKTFARAIIAGLMAMVVVGVVAACGSTNEPPTAVAGEDVAVLAGYPVELDGSASSDPDGDELTYTWTLQSKPEGSEAELSNAGALSATFTPDALGEFVISLAVNDGKSWSLPVSVTISARPWFTDVTEEAGVAGPPVDLGGIRTFERRIRMSGQTKGASWVDYDTDGYYDLYLMYDKGNLLYRNNGDGTFTDVAAEAGLDYKGGVGSVWGDYDGDGDVDLYLTQRKKSVLYRNNGDGTFTDVTDDAGDVGDKGNGAAWGDYDNDKDLDLAVATKSGPEFLYRNNGDGTFTNVAPELNVGQEFLPRGGPEGFQALTSRGIASKSGSTWQAFWFDYTNDGYLDLFFAVDWGTNYLYRNNGDGTFTEVTEEAGIFMLGNGMGVDAGDYDSDGDLDIYVTNFGAAPIAGVGYTRTPNWLFRNNGDGTFSEVSGATGTRGRSGVGWGTHFFDYDQDGDLDLAVANGGWGRYSSREERETEGSINLLFRNDGDGTFTDVTEISGLGSTSMTRGLTLADYDLDGDLDVFMVESDDLNHFYRNDVANYLGNNWLKIRLRGTESNGFGIGSMVRLTSGGVTQMEQLFAGNSYYSSDPPELHFGLAGESAAEKIEVRWPSGIVQMLRDVKANQTITITETRTP